MTGALHTGARPVGRARAVGRVGRTRGIRGLLLVLLLPLAMVGCVAVPTKGPVERVEGQQPACQNCVNVDVAPPAPGADPLEVVQGYLRATSNYQPNFSVAKQFLTKAAAQSWSPEDGASIYTGTPMASGDNVTLDGTLIGSLGPDRTYTARDHKIRVDFGMVQENGQWRISKPPPGLMVEQYSFATFYQPYNLYFIGNQNVLVPDPIYVPSLTSQSSTTSVLMKGLLSGPSTWLKPAVTSAIPTGTALSVDAVTVVDGVADVALSDQVLALNDAQRSLMASQVLYTLKQVPGVQAVVFMVNQQPMRVPGAGADYSVSVSTISPEVDPIPFIAGDQLYAARGDGIRVLDPSATDLNGSRAVPGPLGDGRIPVSDLAVSGSNTDLAVITDGRRSLRRSGTGGGTVTTVLDRSATDLLRPQFTRFGELWAAGRSGGEQRFWVFNGDEELPVQSPLLAGARTTAFQISPDGSRMAIVRQGDGPAELGLARISRGDKVVVNGWRRIDTQQASLPEIARILDVAWIDDTDLLVLGASSANAVPALFRVSQDASRISPDTEPTTWDPTTLTVLLSDQSTVVVGRRGQTWKGTAGQWDPYIDGVRAAAYPG